MNNLYADFYELTMGQAFFDQKIHEKKAVFDIFFRKIPDNANYAIVNGVNRICEFVKNFGYDEENINYLRSLNMFSDEYLDYLKNIKFEGDVIAVPDGNIVFGNEPIVTIKAPLLVAQLLETALLMIFNHASLITTKTNRIVQEAQGRSVMEFGSRRAQGYDAGLLGAVDAYVAGAIGTANTVAGQLYGIPVLGTMAHSFVQAFDNEYDAFKNYAKTFPDNTVLLVDTYDTLNSGIPNAIKVNNEILKPIGKELKGIRIDSGDLLVLTKKVRKLLDEAGLENTKIVVSNSLDEFKIKELMKNNAPIDSFGVGENLIVAKSNPVFGGVYKLVALEKNNKLIPKIKISEDIDKMTNPAEKKLYRFIDKNGYIAGDILALKNEKLLNLDTKGGKIQNLRKLYIKAGRVLIRENIMQIRDRLKFNVDALPKIAKDFDKKWDYPIILTSKLQNEKQKLVFEHKQKMLNGCVNNQDTKLVIKDELNETNNQN